MTANAPIARTTSRLRSIFAALAGCAAAAAAFKQQRRTYEVLSSLDDRTLKDIGLNRTMLLKVSFDGPQSPKGAV